MLKRIVLLVVGVVMVAGVLGCDDAAMKALVGDSARMTGDPGGNQLGDLLMTQLQLRDGSCDGTCDGVPNPDAGAWQGSGGASGAGGSGDQLRLRDGSCGL